MAKRSTLQKSGQAMIFNFWLNEMLAAQTSADYMIWIAAPWVTDFPMPQRYQGAFTDLVSPRTNELRLFDVIGQIAAVGGSVRIVVGGDASHHEPLRQLAEGYQRIEVRKLPMLHAKVYAGRYGAMTGSLNLTGSGTARNIEIYDYAHDERSIALAAEQCSIFFDQGIAL